MEEIINIIANNGLAIGVAVYFLFKDYRQGAQMVESIKATTSVLYEVKAVLAELKTAHMIQQQEE